MQESKAGVLKPSFILIRDQTTKKILLAVRGTHSMKVSHDACEHWSIRVICTVIFG